MPTGGLVALIDDVATVTKAAGQKVTGIIGDDLALNANGLIGISPKRELNVVLRVAKGSLINKAILIPVALGLSAVAPGAITGLLMLGGAYLCYEGAEKIVHALQKKKHDDHAEKPVVAKNEKAYEDMRVKSAVKTDFVLSAEIIVMSLGVAAALPILGQAAVLAAIGVGMTVGVYGFVGGLLKIDDLGLLMAKKEGDGFWAKTARSIGRGLIKSVPHIMNTLSVVGTVAMFAVGGGIILHGLGAVGHAVTGLAHALPHVPGLAFVAETVLTGVSGVIAGMAAIPAVKLLEKPFNACKAFAQKLFGKKKPATVEAEPAIETAKTEMAATVAPSSPINAAPDLSAAMNAVAARPEAVTPADNKPKPPQPPAPPAPGL